MKKLALLLTLALPLSAALTSCGGSTVSLPATAGGTLPKYANIYAGVSYGTFTVTHTPATTTTPEAWSSSSTPAQVNFTSYPGSDAVYIQSYHVVSDTINGVAQPVNSIEMPSSVYVQSGFTCGTVSDVQVKLASYHQSCDPDDATTRQATGITSDATSISMSSNDSFLNSIKAAKGAITRIVKLEFTGVSTRNEKVVYDVNIDFVGTYIAN